MGKWWNAKISKHTAVILIALLACFPAVGIAHAVTTTGTSSLPPATRGVGTPAPSFAPGIPVQAASSGSVTSSNSALPPGKQAFLSRQATAIAAAPQGPPPTKGPPAALSAMNAPATPESGIRDIQISPFRAQEALIANRWQGTVAGTFVVVYAGRLTTPPDQGLVGVSVGTPGTPAFSLQQYPTPTKTGSVRIVAENGTLLTLMSDNGVIFTFDVGTRMFTQGMPTKFPLASPPPTRP